MSTKSKKPTSLAEHYIEILAGWAEVSRRSLFGATALYRSGQIFAMVWKGALYFKVDEQSRPDYEAADSHTLGYSTKKGEDHSLKSYWQVPADVIEDEEKLQAWAEIAYQAALHSAER
jgi:DNA transformation protein